MHILLRILQAWLRERSGYARGRLGAVRFVPHFGSALNAHVQFHCCVIDGVFATGEDRQVRFADWPTASPAPDVDRHQSPSAQEADDPIEASPCANVVALPEAEFVHQ